MGSDFEPVTCLFLWKRYVAILVLGYTRSLKYRIVSMRIYIRGCITLHTRGVSILFALNVSANSIIGATEGARHGNGLAIYSTPSLDL